MEDLHSFKKLALKRFPKLDSREHSEEKFWSKFKFPIVVKDYAAVTSVSFSPVAPHDFAVTGGSRVQVFSATTNEVKKTISRFDKGAYGGCFRGDGRLLAAGTDDGSVKVFDINSRAILRQFKGHSKAVKAVQFSLDGLRVVSGSDDTTLRLWDVATESCLATLDAHEDYIRSVVLSPVSSDLVLSASYDHCLRLWDLRQAGSAGGSPSPGAVMSLDHGAPVEAALIFPSGGTCISAGGNYIKVWDILSGGRLLLAFSNHQKTVTSLCFDGSSQRLLSGSLDKQLKVYSVEDYRVVQSMSYPSPILSVGMSPADTHLVVGMTTRLLSIKYRPYKEMGEESEQATPPKGGTYRFFVRGKTYRPAPDEYVVTQSKKLRLQPYEKFLKTFKYKYALDAALEHRGAGKGKIVYSVLQELARRDGLSIALSGRNEGELYPLLRYLSRSMTLPRFAPLLLGVCSSVVDIYGSTLPQSPPTRALFRVLKVKLDREVQFQKGAFRLLGMLDTILTAATATQRQQTAAVATRGKQSVMVEEGVVTRESKMEEDVEQSEDSNDLRMEEGDS